MWRRALATTATSHPQNPAAVVRDDTSLYSFLQPFIFNLRNCPIRKSNPIAKTTPTLTSDYKSTLQTNLHRSLLSNNTIEAWKSFRCLTSNSTLPPKHLTNSLITHLASLADNLNLKRAFASVVYVIERKPQLLEFDSIRAVLHAMRSANSSSPAFALIKCMIKNRYFVPFRYWGDILVEISRGSGSLVGFLWVFEECCRIAIDDELEFMKPDLYATNAALEGSCKDLESMADAEKILERISVLGVVPNELSFGFLGYLYALKGRKDKIFELKDLMWRFGISNKEQFYSNLVSGYAKSGYLDSIVEILLESLQGEDAEGLSFSEATYREVVNGFLKNGTINGLVNLMVEIQKLQKQEKTIVGIINACIDLGLTDMAHSVVSEIHARTGFVELEAYVPILKSYCKENRTSAATRLVTELSSSGLQLDAEICDVLIETSMAAQDFQSSFALFREMRNGRTNDLKGNYLTIMTGLMENHRPELMAAFLDEVVADPRVDVKTHDWNSIIHAFCKAGRQDDAKRTFRRMICLRFEPNEQTYLSLVSGYVAAENYFSVLILWNEVKRKISVGGGGGIKFDHSLIEAFLFALVRGGFFDAVMQVVAKSQELKIFVDKWKHKQVFMEKHKKLKVSKLRRQNLHKMEALIAFKNWVGLNS